MWFREAWSLSSNLISGPTWMLWSICHILHWGHKSFVLVMSNFSFPEELAEKIFLRTQGLAQIGQVLLAQNVVPFTLIITPSALYPLVCPQVSHLTTLLMTPWCCPAWIIHVLVELSTTWLLVQLEVSHLEQTNSGVKMNLTYVWLTLDYCNKVVTDWVDHTKEIYSHSSEG